MSYNSDTSSYVILINDDNTMTTTQKRRIVQRSKLVDDLWFLVKPEYNGFNMSDFTVLLEYLSPISKKYRTEFLNLSEADYNGYLRYTMQIDTAITAEAGTVEFQISFLKTSIDADGNSGQHVRKITGGSIRVDPITAWSDIIPDSALTALDQRIIKMDAQINAINEVSEIISMTKADNFIFNKDTSELQLTADGDPIGDKVVISTTASDLKDGIPVVDFKSTSVGPEDPDDDDNVVEF